MKIKNRYFVLLGTIVAAAACAVQLEDVKGTFHGFDVFANAEMTKKMISIRSLTLRRAFL